jgi:hypothetical protein
MEQHQRVLFTLIGATKACASLLRVSCDSEAPRVEESIASLADSTSVQAWLDLWLRVRELVRARRAEWNKAGRLAEGHCAMCAVRLAVRLDPALPFPNSEDEIVRRWEEHTAERANRKHQEYFVPYEAGPHLHLVPVGSATATHSEPMVLDKEPSVVGFELIADYHAATVDYKHDDGPLSLAMANP